MEVQVVRLMEEVFTEALMEALMEEVFTEAPTLEALI